MVCNDTTTALIFIQNLSFPQSRLSPTVYTLLHTRRTRRVGPDDPLQQQHSVLMVKKLENRGTSEINGLSCVAKLNWDNCFSCCLRKYTLVSVLICLKDNGRLGSRGLRSWPASCWAHAQQRELTNELRLLQGFPLAWHSGQALS